MERYTVVPVDFHGKLKGIVCSRNNDCSAFVALLNYHFLLKDEDLTTTPPYVLERHMTDEFAATVEAYVNRNVHKADTRKRKGEWRNRKATLVNIARSLGTTTPHLDPMNRGCSDFGDSDELELFQMLGVRLMHGWLVDPQDEKLKGLVVRGLTYDQMVGVLSSLQPPADPDPSSDWETLNKYRIASKDHLTEHGLYKLCNSLADGETAVLYFENQFKILHKLYGDLFTLETDEHMLPNSMWKKLTVDGQNSFYLTQYFAATNPQPNLKLAEDWVLHNIPAPDEDNSAKGEISKSPKNLGNEIEEAEAPKSEFGHSMSDVPAAKDETATTPPAKDESAAAPPAKDLEIQSLPKPKSIQSFEQFAKENEMFGECTLYDNVVDNTTTFTGRAMGLGYLNHILDKFECGKCWGKRWKKSEMEVRNRTEFVIIVEADAELTEHRAVDNLRNYCDILFPCYEGKRVKKHPAYFHSFLDDVIEMPDPNGDPKIWRRFLQLMRSHLVWKAPAARSTLISNIHRLLPPQFVVNSPEFNALTARLVRPDWRKCVRNLEPFSRVYKFKNNISHDFTSDKWENCHWHILKYSRHFIEHVLIYLKGNAMLQDISVVELMLARCLEHYLAKAIRTVVYSYGVDSVLYSAWGFFESSDCKIMPRQILPEASGDTPESVTHKHDEAKEDMVPEEMLVIRVSSMKQGERRTVWAYSEVRKAYSHSSVGCSVVLDAAAVEQPAASSSLSAATAAGAASTDGATDIQKSILEGDLHLPEFKRFLENKNFQVESSCDSLSREEYIMITKMDVLQRFPEIVVEGTWCEEYGKILEHVGAWLCL